MVWENLQSKTLEQSRMVADWFGFRRATVIITIRFLDFFLSGALHFLKIIGEFGIKGL